MQLSKENSPFPFSPTRFDQKNEMFKRVLWDKKVLHLGNRFYKQAKFRSNIGYRRLDYAFMNASWNLERNAGFGNSRSNYGLYSWEEVNDMAKLYVENDGSINESPEKMSNYIKKVARYFGASQVGICQISSNWIYSYEYNPLSAHKKLIFCDFFTCNSLRLRMFLFHIFYRRHT